MDQWEDILFHYLQDDYPFPISDDFMTSLMRPVDTPPQDMAFSSPLATKRKLFQIGGSQIQGGELAEDVWQTCQNQPKQEAMQAIHNDVRPAMKENSKTPCLNEKKGNILPNGTEFEVCNLKGKATSGSMTPKTPIERKRLNDQNYRKRKREENKNLQENNKNLLEENAQLKIEMEQLRNYQPKSSFVKRKAKFKLNFHDDDSKIKEAMKMAVDLPDMDDIHLKVRKGTVTLKLKGSFDTQAVFHKLNRVCETHLLSKVNVPSSMPGPSTAAKLPVRAVKLR